MPPSHNTRTELSRLFKFPNSLLDGKACWIEGNATPFGMYVRLYRHRDQFVVIDDVDALVRRIAS